MPDYLWEPVVSNVREQLLDTFSFARRELGQDVVLSEVISAIQSIAGVAYIDVDLLGSVPEKEAAADGTRQLLTPAAITDAVQALVAPAASGQSSANLPPSRLVVNLAGLDKGTLRPAELAILPPSVPSALVLNQIK